MCVVIHAAKIIHKKVKCKLLEVKLQSCLFFFIACPARIPLFFIIPMLAFFYYPHQIKPPKT